MINNLKKGRLLMTASRLKVERVKLGLTQFDFWKKAEIPQWKVSLIERGLKPTKEEALKIAGVLGQNVQELFPGFEDNALRAAGG
jgi:DNA-binding XRE family transcriptional regulator